MNLIFFLLDSIDSFSQKYDRLTFAIHSYRKWLCHDLFVNNANDGTFNWHSSFVCLWQCLRHIWCGNLHWLLSRFVKNRVVNWNSDWLNKKYINLGHNPFFFDRVKWSWTTHMDGSRNSPKINRLFLIAFSCRFSENTLKSDFISLITGEIS